MNGQDLHNKPHPRPSLHPRGLAASAKLSGAVYTNNIFRRKVSNSISTPSANGSRSGFPLAGTSMSGTWLRTNQMLMSTDVETN